MKIFKSNSDEVNGNKEYVFGNRTPKGQAALQSREDDTANLVGMGGGT